MSSLIIAIIILVYMCIGAGYANVFYIIEKNVSADDVFIPTVVYLVCFWPIVILFNIFTFAFQLINKLCKKLKEEIKETKNGNNEHNIY